MKTALNKEEQAALQQIISVALGEDIGTGDITSRLTIPSGTMAEIRFVAREDMIACGTFVPEAVYRQLDGKIQTSVKCRDGQAVKSGDVLAMANGPAAALLAGERVILNLMQHLSGVASLTARYVKEVEGTGAVILDTRKTLPGLRSLEKYAVRAGGGQNHRLRLDDMVLIKDNHIALCGGITRAVQKARVGTPLLVEVECDSLVEVEEALTAKPDRILLDNMTPDDIRKAVQLAAGKISLEASGGIDLGNVRSVAQTGVDYISIGRLTHSAPAADISGEIRSRS